MPSFKHNRTAEDIRREITLLIRELKDPRVKDKMLTVVRVEVSTDASFAKVYVSDLKGIDSAKEAVEGLTAATGRIRREVGQRVRLRYTPELSLELDDTMAYSAHIQELLLRVQKEEQEKKGGETE